MTKDLINRITYHLSSGGLFNPELADHLAVRNLLMECREALAQPEQEPVQWGVDWGKAGETPCVSIIKRKPNGGIEVVAVEYGPPPQHTWVGLTDEEVNKFVDDEDWYNFPHEFAKAVEAKLKEKNT